MARQDFVQQEEARISSLIEDFQDFWLKLAHYSNYKDFMLNNVKNFPTCHDWVGLFIVVDDELLVYMVKGGYMK